MRKRSVTNAVVVLLAALLVLTSSLVSAKHYRKHVSEGGAPPSTSGTGLFTICQMAFRLKGWSAVDKTARGAGTITCDNGQKAKVKIEARDGLTAGRSEVRDGYGKFSPVTDISELFGTYVAAGATTGPIVDLTKAPVHLALRGKGTAFEVGGTFGKFTITKL